MLIFGLQIKLYASVCYVIDCSYIILRLRVWYHVDLKYAGSFVAVLFVSVFQKKIYVDNVASQLNHEKQRTSVTST